MRKVSLKIGGMSCTACSSSLEKFLNKQCGVESASVNLLLNTADIEFDESLLTLADVESFVSKIGFESLGVVKGNPLSSKTDLGKSTLVVLFVLAFTLIVLAMLVQPLCSGSYFLVCSFTQFLLALCAAFVAFPLLKRGILGFFYRVPTMESLVSLGWCASFFYSCYLLVISFWYSAITNFYFDSSVMVLFFVHLGFFIENYHKDKSANVIYSLAMMTPVSATVVDENGVERNVGIADVKPGDKLVCKPFERLAADGVVLSGQSYVDESFVSGESIPLLKEEGSFVIAGSQNDNGAFIYKVRQVGRNSSISAIVRMVTEAANSRSSFQRLADRASAVFVYLVLGVAVFSFFYWYCFTGVGLSYAVVSFVNVLVVACPCALGISAPLAVLAATNKAASIGILVKNASKFEVLPKTDTAFLDKTGTLTKGKMFVNNSYYFDGCSESSVLPLVAAVEAQSHHPIGNALVELASTKGFSLPLVSDFLCEPGFGLSAHVNGLPVLVGSSEWLSKNEVDCSSFEVGNSSTDSLVYCALDGKLCVVYGINDTLKDSAVNFVSQLQKMRISVHLLSGDNESAVNSVASMVGISQVHSKTQPVDKARIIEAVHNEGHITLMFGDGINDAPALVRSDVGLSISSGTEIAANSADFILMSGDLSKVISLFRLAKNTCSVIRQNLFWAFLYNSCMLPVAAGFLSCWGVHMSPHWSALAMVLSSLLVLANSYRIKLMRFD